jgi:hypothetical protein
MKRISDGFPAGASPGLENPDDAAPRYVRCSICEHRVGGSVTYLEETGDVPDPRQSWTLCQTCAAAVRVEMERSPVLGALRVRIAVGLVAAERSPRAWRRPRSGMTDDAWLHFLFWGFGIAMFVHIVVIAWIATLIR